MNPPHRDSGSPADALHPFLIGGYAPELGRFDEARFQKNWHLTFFLVLSFIRRFNQRDLSATQGDPMLALVLSEIWLYNVSRSLLAGHVIDSAALQEPALRRQLLPRCNAYSIAQALGLPAETVRRKVNTLIGLGWVERTGRRELVTTAALETHYAPGLGLETMRDFLSTARAVMGQLDESRA